MTHLDVEVPTIISPLVICASPSSSSFLTFLLPSQKSDVQGWLANDSIQESFSTQGYHFNQKCLITFASQMRQSDHRMTFVFFWRASLGREVQDSLEYAVHLLSSSKLNRCWMHRMCGFFCKKIRALTLFFSTIFFFPQMGVKETTHSNIKNWTEGLTRYQFLQDLQVVHNLCKPGILKHTGALDFYTAKGIVADR